MKLCEMIEEMGERSHMRVAFVGAGGKNQLHAGAGTTVEETGKKSVGYDFCSYGESEKFPAERHNRG